MSITTAEIEALTSWSDGQEVKTKHGPRLLRKANPSPAFDATWQTRRDDLKAAGVNFSKNNYNGKWELVWWQPLTAEAVAARNQAVEASRATSADVELPHPAGLNYLPFQRAGIAELLRRPRALLADQMGLGKTVQAVGLINADPTIESAVVVCPKSLKLNWHAELKRWLVRPLTVGVADGKHWPGTDIVILNYEALEKYRPYLLAREWGVLILDEAHLIKNAKTMRSALIKGRPYRAERKRTVKGQTKTIPAQPALDPLRARRHLRLTGTPIVNRPVELQNIVDDLDTTFAGWKYLKRYCNAQHGRFGWDFSGASHLDELQRSLRETVMIRRLKADVLTELPAKLRQVIELEPETDNQAAAVAAELEAEARHAALIAELKSAAEAVRADTDAYAVAVEKLREAESVAFEEMSRRRHDTAMAKLPLVVARLAEALEDNDDKIIVGAHHRDVIEGLVAAGEAAGWNPVYIHGQTNEVARDQAVRRFQTDPSVRLFVGSILAAGVGLTLTASAHVVFAELDWVPGNVSQFEDRAHRIGQTDSVLVWHLVMAGSLDARMARLLVEKQEVIDKALDRELAPLTAPAPATVQPAVGAPATVQPATDPAPAPTSPTTAPSAVLPAADQPTADQIAAAHSALRLLAGLDPDRALTRNGEGFSRIDGAFGHDLAARATLTPKQGLYAVKLARKYRRQLPDELVARIGAPAKKSRKEANHA